MHPTTFGEYQVRSYLGDGAFAHTYEVEAPDGEHLALKWLRESPAEHGRERFTNEVWALRSLNHPSIPRLVAQGSHLNRPFIVMSLANGVTLRKIYLTQVEEQGVMSQQRLLAILEELLEAVEHMHDQGIYHRDIKDDNIIVNSSESQVTLIDLGMCTGPDQPVDAATFWNAGASRFSPPSKLHHPTEAHPSHDVFALGVVGYLFLTNVFPWSVGDDADRGHLEDLMRRQRPTPINQRNTFVSRELSDFLLSLIVVDDDSRPAPSQALTTIRELRSRTAAQLAPSAIVRGAIIKLPRVVRDSVHGDILMTELEWRVIATQEFQRLRWIRQLGTANLVYPGAEHTRFSHAIGTMFVADYILRRIEERTGNPFEPEERLMARLYALVHDVTHIAFGHTLEDELSIFERHDQNDQRIARLLLGSRSQLGEVLRSTEYGRLVLAHFDSASTVGTYSWLKELVRSSSGADVIDYIGRDSLHCGLDHKVDSAIFRRFSIGSRDQAEPERRHLRAQLYGRAGLRLDAEYALESILYERLGLFMKVYTHPAKTAAGCMVGKALWEAVSQQKDRRFDERRVERMGDDELIYSLRDSGKAVPKRLCLGLLERDLYKPAFRSRALESQHCDLKHYEVRQAKFAKLGLFDPAKRASAEATIARQAGLKPPEVIVYCPRKAPGLQRVRQYVETKPDREELRDEAHDPHLRIYSAPLDGLRVCTSVNRDKCP